MGQLTSYYFEGQEGSLRLTVGVLVPRGLCLLARLRLFNCLARLRIQLLASSIDLFGLSVKRQTRGKSSTAKPWGLRHELLVEFLGHKTQANSFAQAAQLDSLQNLCSEH